MTHLSPGRLITFEGIEGSGKSTQLAMLGKRLREHGYRVIETREPGGTAIGEAIRRLLLDSTPTRRSDRAAAPTAECEAGLVFAARAQHVADVIAPSLAAGAVVLCDRFVDSTLAYQGYGRGLDLRRLRAFNRFAARGLDPHLTFVFDLPVSRGLERRRRDAAKENRLDREASAFHRRVREGFLALARSERRRIRVVNADRDPESIALEVWNHVARVLQRSSPPRRRR